MPDLLRDEETENRTHSLCLFNVSGTTRNNRCENCPGAARTRALYQQRRCPLDVDSEHNIFSPVGAPAEGKSETIDPKSDPKSLATSSKLQHGPDALGKISDKIAGISLDGTARKFVRRSRSDPGICNTSTDMSLSVPHVDIGVKRKADHEPESSFRNIELADVHIAHNDASHDQMEAVQNATSNKLGAVSPRDGSSDIGTEWMQQNKHLKRFQGPRVEGLDTILADVFNSLTIDSDGISVNTDDDHHSEGDISIEQRTELAGVIPHKARVHTEVDDLMPKFKDGSSDVEKYLQNKAPIIFQDLQSDVLEGSWGVYTDVPASLGSLLNSFDSNPNIMQEDHRSGKASSFGMIIGEQRVPPCNHGILNYIFKYNDPKEGGLMIAEEITELSIDQIEERRIDGSSFF